MIDISDKLKMVWNSIYKLENKAKLYELQDERIINLDSKLDGHIAKIYHLDTTEIMEKITEMEKKHETLKKYLMSEDSKYYKLVRKQLRDKKERIKKLEEWKVSYTGAWNIRTGVQQIIEDKIKNIEEWSNKVPQWFTRIEKLEVERKAQNGQIEYWGKQVEELKASSASHTKRMDRWKENDYNVEQQQNRGLKELDKSNRLTHNRSCSNKEVLRIIVEDYYEGTFKESMLETLGGDSVQNRIDRLDKGFEILKKHEEAMPYANGQDSKPPSLINTSEPLYPSEQDAGSARQTDRGRWTGKNWTKEKWKEYQKRIKEGFPEWNTVIIEDLPVGKYENPKEKEPTELYCFCCGSPVKEEKNCFCLPCFNEAQETPEGHKLVEKEDLDDLLTEVKEWIQDLYDAEGYSSEDLSKTIVSFEKKYLEEK